MKQKKTDLNKLTFEQLTKKVEELKKQKEQTPHQKRLTYCIIRTYSAGVFAGLINRINKEKTGTIYDSRRIYYWDGAASLSQLANEGVKKPENCKFAQQVKETDLTEIIEVIPCTVEAESNIQKVKVWEK